MCAALTSRAPRAALMLPDMRATASECLENARVCLRWADMARDPEDRRAYIDLAHTWFLAAGRAGLEPAPAAPAVWPPGREMNGS